MSAPGPDRHSRHALIRAPALPAPSMLGEASEGAVEAPSEMIHLVVNGRPVDLAVPAHALLLDVLRDRLDLKGAKRSCDNQVCGACTVLVDGLAVSACTYLAVEADGRTLLTVEGLAEGETLHPLQRAFLEAGAVQCGFCTAGMLVTARALLDEHATPTHDDVLHYLRGSLCRCTGYRKIVEAVLAAARGAA